MIKHTQTISRQFVDGLFECVCDDFVKLVHKGLKNKYNGHTLNS